MSTRSGELQERVWDRLFERLGEVGGRPVLELGSSAGGFVPHLRAAGATVTAFDLSHASLLRNAAAGGRVQGDAHRLPFADGAFEVVVGNGILHHLEMEAALGEIRRVLAEDGRAAFTEPLAGHPAVRLVRRATPSARTEDEHPFGERELRQIEAAFSRVEAEERYLTAVMAAPPNLLSGGLADRITGGLDRLDRVLFSSFPSLRRYAWIVTLYCEA